MMLLRLEALQTETVLVRMAGVVGSSHSPHSQQGSVLVTMTAGGIVMSSHSGHGSASATTRDNR